MAIDNAHYHGWQGELRAPAMASVAIVRVALLQVLRRKSYWFVLALGLLNFLFFFSLIYAKTQLPQVGRDRQNRILERFDFSPEPPRGKESGYISFINRQSLVVMILLAFSGSLLIGSDFRSGALPFYLSRRIDRRHYIAGKLLAVSCVVALLTTVPALVLFVEYGLLTSSFDYFVDYWQVPLSIAGYSVVMCGVLSIWLVTISAYLQRMVPIAVTWASAFALLATMAAQLSRATHDNHWGLLDPWRDIRLVGKLCFGFTDSPDERALAGWAAAILAGLCCTALAALVHRVRAVEVVE